ncbi:MAG: S8 family serine peptidase [Actinomycetota bacterium]|nr:S8 family serine peptidase [Actinomycetota bacterium]
MTGPRGVARARLRRISAASLVALLTGSAAVAATPAYAAGSPATAAVAAAVAGSPAADGNDVRVVARLVDRDGRPRFREVHAPTVAAERRAAAALPGSVGVAVDVPVSIATLPGSAAPGDAAVPAGSTTAPAGAAVPVNTAAVAAAASPDPYRSRQWGNDTLKIDELPAVDTGSQIVAVLDTGVLASHEDFGAGQVLCHLGADFTGEGRTPANGCIDPHGHGTHVAGIVGAVKGNGKGVEGAAAGVKILPVRVLGATGGGTALAAANGIIWAVDHGATVVSMSLGGGYSSVYDDAIRYANSKNVTVVAAVGNNRTDGNAVLWPAASPGAIGVAAIDRNGVSTSWSNSNVTSDISAPGDFIYSLYSRSGYPPYVYMSGTSMATPYASAVVALHRAAHPAATDAQVQQALYGTANDLEIPGRDDNTGWGMVDPYQLLAGAEYGTIAAPTAPAAPTGIAGNGTAELSWKPVTSRVAAPVTGYHVYRDGNRVATVAGTSYADANLVNATPYAYSVSAYGDGGESERSAATTVTPQERIAAPATPSGLAAEPGDAAVTLSWGAVPGSDSSPLTGYRLYRDGSLVATVSGTSHVDAGLVNGRAYAYTVAAYGPGGQSGASEPVTATPEAPLAAPARPTGVTARGGVATVTLSWAPVTDTTTAPVSGYRVFRNGIEVAAPTGTSFTDKAVTSGQRYSYTVAAYGPGGQSAASAPVRAVPLYPAASVTLSAVKVAKNARIGVTSRHFRPGTAVVVSESYSYVARGRTYRAVRQLAVGRVPSSGTWQASVLPVQTAPTGTLYVRGTDQNGRQVGFMGTIGVD